MNKLGDLLVRLLVMLVILAVGTYVIGFILNLVAIYIPPAATYVYCPPGTQMTYSWSRTSYDHPGEQSLGGDCVTPQGQHLQKLPDSIVTPREFALFMPLGFAIMLLIFAARAFIGFFKARGSSPA